MNTPEQLLSKNRVGSHFFALLYVLAVSVKTGVTVWYAITKIMDNKWAFQFHDHDDMPNITTSDDSKDTHSVDECYRIDLVLISLIFIAGIFYVWTTTQTLLLVRILKMDCRKKLSNWLRNWIPFSLIELCFAILCPFLLASQQFIYALVSGSFSVFCLYMLLASVIKLRKSVCTSQGEDIEIQSYVYLHLK